MEKMKLENKEKTFEIMKIPEVVIQNEQGAQLFSLILKAENPEWGETETPITKETIKYFKENPLNPEILEMIQEFHEEGVDKEILYNLALTYQHSERVEKVFEMAEKYKPHVKNFQEKYQRFLSILEKFDKTFSTSPLADKFVVELEQDKNERLKNLENIKSRIEKLIDFFKPDSKTTKIKELSFIPTNPLQGKHSGRAFLFGSEQVIMSHIDNVDNQDHEFMHGIINPIIDKLFKQLSNEKKERILDLTSNKLKQDYKTPYSILCEEFIRTYNDIFKKEERPQTYEDFKEKISDITEEQFQKFLLKNENLQIRCNELNITSIKDLYTKSQEYFERFEKSQLQNLIFKLYQKYSNRPDKNENFEQFILKQFMDKI